MLPFPTVIANMTMAINITKVTVTVTCVTKIVAVIVTVIKLFYC